MLTLNGIKVPITLFPDNSSQVWNIPQEALEGETYYIEWDFSHEMEFLHLAQLKTLLNNTNFQKQVQLYMPFLPFGRQDKDISNENTFALHTFAGLINSLRFDKVITLDAHSNLGEKLFNNYKSIKPRKVINKAFSESNSNMIVYPDKGSLERYNLDYLRLESVPIITGNKVRNQETGYIEEYTFEGDPKDKKVLIIDDIVDGGMTFILLTRDLLKSGAKEVNLYCTHGIFSKGKKVLFDSGINRIFLQTFFF